MYAECVGFLMVPKRQVVFFAWQSDSPRKTNRSAIKMALLDAISTLESDWHQKELSFDLQEATREDDPGSPAIAAKLLEKIEASNVFVGDVTTINPHSDNSVDKTANGNVMYEVGYAMAHLGEERVILIFNEAFGVVERDLPFDVRHQRITKYRMAEEEAGKRGQAQARLNGLMRSALKAVIEKDPKRPAELKGKTDKQIRRERDVQNITWLLRTIHWPSIDQHLQNAPHMRAGSTEYYLLMFEDVLNNSYFHLYDEELMDHLQQFRKLWWFTYYGHEGHYSNPDGANYEIFQMPGDVIRTRAQESAWKALTGGVREMRRVRDDLLKYIRKNYIEIDVRACSDAARKELKRVHSKIDQSVARKLGPLG
jgi:hypothetical protein